MRWTRSIEEVLRQVLDGDKLKVSATDSISASSANEATVAVTDAATLLLAANTSRKGGYIANVTTNLVWIGYHGAITSGSAGDNGGYLDRGGTLDLVDQGSIYTGAVYGICESGSAARIAYTEVI